MINNMASVVQLTFGDSYKNTDMGLPGAHSSLTLGSFAMATDSTHSSLSYTETLINQQSSINNLHDTSNERVR